MPDRDPVAEAAAHQPEWVLKGYAVSHGLPDWQACTVCDTRWPCLTHRLAAEIERLREDAKRLDWLERRLTLHKGIEWLYVVDGYEVSTTYDGNTEQSYAGTTLRAAIDAAIAAQEGTK